MRGVTAFAKGFLLAEASDGQSGGSSELDLVARIRAGDAAAFDAIHAEFNGRLFNFLARLSRRREVAEDLLDETWLRFVDRAPKLKPDTRLGPFLFTVARNLYVSYCRSRMLEDSQISGRDRVVAARHAAAVAVRCDRCERDGTTTG